MQLAPLLLLALIQDTPGWRYEIPPSGEALYRPTLRELPLAAKLPEDWKCDVEFSGVLQRFGAFRFGDADSTRIAVVLDHRSDTGVELYVDRNRDLSIDARDRIEGRGPVWEVELDAEAVDASGRSVRLPRKLSIELGPTGAVLGLATLGGLVGSLELEGRSLHCLRRDGDANGHFSDPDDQLWIDLDGDGEFEALGELFLVQPVLRLEGRRYRVRTDRLGTDVKLERLEGTGSIRIPTCNGRALASGADVQVLMTSREGDVVAVRSAALSSEVPPGSYRITTVTARLPDPAGGEAWSFVFGEMDPSRNGPWHEIRTSATVELDPLIGLEFSLRGAVPSGDLEPQSRFLLRPELTTSDGLRIIVAHRGSPNAGWDSRTLWAETRLFDARSRERTLQRSGFG
jgi:hypothetical protein